MDDPGLKSLMLKRQLAFHYHGADSVSFRLCKNLVNHTRKRCKSKFYEPRILYLKNDNPRRWWSKVKRLNRSHLMPGDSVLHHIIVAELDILPLKDVPNTISGTFLEPPEEY